MTYRDARNESTAAQASTDVIVHLTTEAALNQAEGLAVDKDVILDKIERLAAKSAEQLARCIAVITGL